MEESSKTPQCDKDVQSRIQDIVNLYPYKDGDITSLVKRQLQIMLNMELSEDKKTAINHEYTHSNSTSITLWYPHTKRGCTTLLGYFLSSMEGSSISMNDIWECIELLLQNGAIIATPTRIAKQFYRNMVSRSIQPNIIALRLKFLLKSINKNNSEQIRKSIITHNLSEPLHSIEMYSYLIPSPIALGVYLEQEYAILDIIDNSGILYLQYEKEYIVKCLIRNDLKNKDSFIKYLFAFRIFSKQFRQKKVEQLCDILQNISLKHNRDVIDLLLTFVYDGMDYLKYSTEDKDLEFVNNSLEMYGCLSPKWRNWIYDNYIMKIPKDELAKLNSFAYLCYL